ncbi:MAG: cytochrome c, partial [Chloroflexota bacterium]
GGQGGQVTISVARPLPVSVPVMLRWSVAAEALLAAAILVAVGWLVTLEPARQVASRMGLGRANDLNFVDTADTTTVQLIIEPGQVGLNRFQVTLTDPIQRAIPNATVTVRLTYLETEMGGMATEATHQGVGVYETPDTFLSLAGQWQAEVIVRRPDAFDAQTAFRFEVMPGSAAGSAAIAPTAETGKLLWGIELALLGLLFTGVSVPLGSWRTRRGRATAVPGTLALLAGIFVVVSAQLGGRPPERINPIAPTQESILMGQSLYATKCLECHGPTGLGNGPRAMEVNPPPAVLITHVPLHTDGELFDFIYEGRPNTAMRPFRDELAEEEIWHIVNFIKTFVIE